MVRKSLGRGLEAILGDATPSTGNLGSGATLPITDITPDPTQPRKQFDEAALDELAASIRVHGLLQPVLVRPASEAGTYVLIAGERRWRAAGRAGLHEIPVLIRDAEPALSAELALIENLQRADLNAMEEADAYASLRDRHGRSVQDIAAGVGKSRSHVANVLRLTALPDEVKAAVIAGHLSMGHARALLAASNPVALSRRIIEGGLSVRETERLAAGRTATASTPSEPGTGSGRTPAKPSTSPKDADTKSLERDLEAALGLSVAIEHTKRGGTLTLTYDTLEQLDDVCRRLMGAMV